MGLARRPCDSKKWGRFEGPEKAPDVPIRGSLGLGSTQPRRPRSIVCLRVCFLGTVSTRLVLSGSLSSLETFTGAGLGVCCYRMEYVCTIIMQVTTRP